MRPCRICPQILIIVQRIVESIILFSTSSNNQLYNMNTLMNVVYLAFAAVFVSAQFNTALADVVSPTPIFLSTFSTHTPALVTRISHASLVFSLAPARVRGGRRTPRPSHSTCARAGPPLFPSRLSYPDDDPFRAERRPPL